MMKPLPRDKKALLAEATSLGVLGPNLSSEEPRAKLLQCIHSSMKIGRCINHVSIVLVGSTGVGKSTTVNHLLGFNLAEASETQSETRCTKEYIVHGSDPKYEVEKLSLGLIDTPGFCDTDGSKQDACNLLSMKKFFVTHPKLSKCYPNLIFLVVKATDNRIKGENSELGKSLRCVKQLGLVDPNNPNVVIILTHACSIRRRNGNEWSRVLEEIKSNVSKVVFNDLNVFAPAVVIENMYDHCGLEVCGDYTRLPNDELQPKNLYVTCAELLTNNNDHLGLITLNSSFVESDKDKDRCITHGHVFEAKNARQSALDGEERAMVELYENAAKGGTILRHHIFFYNSSDVISAYYRRSRQVLFNNLSILIAIMIEKVLYLLRIRLSIRKSQKGYVVTISRVPPETVLNLSKRIYQVTTPL